ncbi:hypothetical protein [Glycomyces harbinensis]|uniref:Tetratricopeptide repeat-containing protein n=1 Tax=Glycomyces harbinensis TaxID=58114 RepID=A0A1G7DKI1_9ACTN|nr:hypothetical protein [Glycomyces harbinensis]SDE52022.1 hypothetical protein SAMN05216270_12610 [Glycomyces harbinensis]
MPDTNSELRQTFNRICAQPSGESRTVALETLLEAVDATGEQPLLNEILAEIVNAFRWSEDSLRHLSAYGRLLRNYDTAPEWFDEHTLYKLHWALHTIGLKMLGRHDVPLASIEAYLLQMRRHYAEAGHSVHPAHQIEYDLAVQLGDGERAAKALAALHSTEINRLDDCEPCVHSAMGSIYAGAGDHERAMQQWAPVLEGGQRCLSEPYRALADSLMPLVELGRLDEARANHLHGYQIIRDKDEMVLPLAQHVRFCALTGNEARAVELLHARAVVFTLALDPIFRLRLLESVQLACAALIARGGGDVQVPGPDGRNARADAAFDRIDAERRDLCERFDRRNGNDLMSRRSAERIAYTTAHPHVPLGLKAAIADAPQVRESRAEAPASTAADLECLLAEARAAGAAFADDRLERWGRVGEAAERLGVALEPSDEAEVLVFRLNDTDDPDRKRALTVRAADLFRKADREGRALTLEASMLRSDEDADVEAVRAEAAGLLGVAERLADADPVHSLRGRVSVHSALAELGERRGIEPDARLREAIAALDADLAARPDERGVTEARVRLLLVMARVVESDDDRNAAIRAAYELACAADHALETVVSALWYNVLLRNEERREEALAVAEKGMAAARPGMKDATIGAIHSAAAETAVSLEHWSRAELYAVQAARYHDRSGQSRLATIARHMAGVAMAEQGRNEAAVHVLWAVLEELAEADDEDEQWRTVDVRILLGDCYKQLGDREEASKQALEALRLMDGGIRHPNATQYARTAHQTGELLEEMGDVASAVLAFGRAERAWRERGVVPAAAWSVRAAIWARVEVDEADEEADSAAFAALAAELRTQWGDEELAPSYREFCRADLAETLLQHGSYLADDAAAIPLLREALEVFREGEYGIGARELSGARELMRRLAETGDAEGAAAVAEQTLGRLEPDENPGFRKRVEEAVAEYRDAAASDRPGSDRSE